MELGNSRCIICGESYSPDEIDIHEICEVCNGAIGNIFISKTASLTEEEE